MTLIVLVRHGQASWGHADYDVLSPHGHDQARALGTAWRASGFQPTRLLTGTMRRHRETAEGIVAGMGADRLPEVVSGLEEFDHVDVFAESIADDGRLPDLDEASMEAVFVEGMQRWITGDASRSYRETYPEFRARVREAFGGLVASVGPEEKAAVVTSGGVIASIVCDLLGIEATRWPTLAAPIVNSSMHRILVRNDEPTLLSFNEHAHLAADDITYA